MQSLEPKTSIKVFISYTHADQDLRKKLEDHLNPLKHSREITIWQDQEIPAGATWEDQIDTHLNAANIILLLISASFIASKYCWNKEVQDALEQHKAGTARVIPIILRPVNWKDTPLEHLQALPKGAKPVIQWNDQDAALEDAAIGIRKVVEDLLRTYREEPALQSSPQDSLKNVLPSPPQKQQRMRLWYVLPVLLSLMLIFIGVGSFILRNAGQGTGNTSHHQPTSLTLSKSHQSTATAQANANATTQANNIAATVAAQANANATTQANNIAATATAQARAASGRTWHAQTSGSSQSLFGIASSGPLFVAVRDSGTILTSSNGLSWDSATSGSSQGLLGIASSGPLFVAVGDGGTILTSSNGLSWTSRTSGTSQRLYGVAPSGSLFVAVGNNGTILTSPDGLSWTPRTSGSSSTLWGVSGSGSLFVAVGKSGTILTSPDGLSWTPRTSPTSQNLYKIVWSGSLFVTVGRGGTILTSP